MLGELKDKDFYCCGFSTDLCGHFPVCPEICRMRRHKYPTPKQFKEEHGVEYPDDGAVYARCKKIIGWYSMGYGYAKTSSEYDYIVCACTPFGSPPADWRP